MKIFAKKKWLQKKQPAFSVLEVMIAGIIFLSKYFFKSQKSFFKKLQLDFNSQYGIH